MSGDSGRGEGVTGQSWLSNSFALYLFSTEDFLACGGHLVPVSENSSSAVCCVSNLHSWSAKYFRMVWSLLEFKEHSVSLAFP